MSDFDELLPVLVEILVNELLPVLVEILVR